MEHFLDRHYFEKQEQLPESICNCQWCERQIFEVSETFHIEMNYDENFNNILFGSVLICYDCYIKLKSCEDKSMVVNIAIFDLDHAKISNEAFAKILTDIGKQDLITEWI